jgi:hypothetical protein
MQDWTIFYGNLFMCPAGERVDDCPIRLIEYLPFIEKINWFNELPKEEKQKIVMHHDACSAKREKDKKDK